MLSVYQIHKMYEGQPLLKGVSFEVRSGETVCLLGPSGSGKSTLLRITAGLEGAESGVISWDGVDLAGTPVHKRNFGLMFQDYALFPHRNVYENVAFGLRMQGLPAVEIRRRVEEALEQVELLQFVERRVTDLSGGEQQRVALARALAPRPRLLMLDEPLGALDRTLREQLLEVIRHLLHTSAAPAVYVTHDQEEAFAIASRLILLHEGKIVQEGAPEEIYARPVSAWVARFLGMSNFLPGRVTAVRPLQVQTESGEFRCAAAQGSPLAVGSQVELLFRPSEASLQPGANGENLIEGQVEDVVFRGQDFKVSLRIKTGLVFQFNLAGRVRVGERLSLWLPPEAVHCIDQG